LYTLLVGGRAFIALMIQAPFLVWIFCPGNQILQRIY
jgi:hypothetical protein